MKNKIIKKAEKIGRGTKGFFNEFKKFAMQGNVLDLAVGVIIGAAFKDVVDSLVQKILTPIINSFGATSADELGALSIKLWSGQIIELGDFISSLISFLIMAFIIFLIVKGVKKLGDLGRKKDEDTAPLTKICPFCKSEIPIDATRCAHCTSILEEAEIAE